MKKLIFLLLLATSAFGQFKVVTTNQYTPISFAERQRAESFPLSIANYNAVKGTGTVATTSWNVGYNNQMLITGQKYNSANANANQLMYVTTNGNRVVSMGSISVTCSYTASGVNSLTLATTTGIGGTTYTIANGQTLTIPGYDVHAPDFFILYLLGSANDTAPVQFVITVNNGWDMTDDDRTQLRFIQLGIGDSLTNGTGTVQTVDTWQYGLNQYYQNRGYFMRMVNRGEYGKKTDYLANRLLYNHYGVNPQNIAVITYMAGTNDALLGSTTITSGQLDLIQTNMTVMLTYRSTYCPWTVLYMCAPPSISNSYQTTYAQSTAESNLALIRARMRTAVTAWLSAHPTDTKCRFVDFGGTAGDPAFPNPTLDKTSGTQYSDGLHWNKAGNALATATITNYIDLPANKNVLVPSFNYSLN